MYDQKQVNFRKQMYGLLPFVLPDWRPQPSGRLGQIVFLVNFIFIILDWKNQRALSC